MVAKADPAGIGNEEQGSDPICVPAAPDESKDQHKQHRDDRERDGRHPQAEEERRPEKIEHHLPAQISMPTDRCPRIHVRAPAIPIRT
jgi:hypothetical protein